MLSADEKTRCLAEIREKALKNEISELSAAKEKGRQEGRQEGFEQGERIKAADTAKKLLSMGVLTYEQIAEATGLTEQEIRNLTDAECGNNTPAQFV